MEALPMPDTSLMSEVLIAPMYQRIEQARRATVVEKKQRSPSFTLGYFNQSIRPDLPYQGAQVGMALPIFNKARNARTEASRLQEVVAQNDLEQFAHQLDQQRQELGQNLELLASQWADQGTALAEQANLLRQLAEQQLQEGEVDYFRYLQSQEAALQSDLERMALLHQYNRSLLRYYHLLGYFPGGI